MTDAPCFLTGKSSSFSSEGKSADLYGLSVVFTWLGIPFVIGDEIKMAVIYFLDKEDDLFLFDLDSEVSATGSSSLTKDALL